jgi:polypeptide N-acetylgalactosaminyltransferase
LHEILLINDASTFNELQIPLEKYITTGSFEGKIKIHHNEKREGLIRARMIGARLAEAEVIVFLDSHMEVGVTWLPPLLGNIERKSLKYSKFYVYFLISEPLVNDRTFAVVPIGKRLR